MLPFHCKRIKSDWSKKLKIGFLPEIFISYSISPQKSKSWVKLGFHLSPDKHSEATAKEGVFSVICKSRTVFCKLLGLADTSGDQSFSPADGKLMFKSHKASAKDYTPACFEVWLKQLLLLCSLGVPSKENQPLGQGLLDNLHGKGQTLGELCWALAKGSHHPQMILGI